MTIKHCNLSIAIISDYINPYIGGHSRNIYYLAKALRRVGCDITFYCLDDPLNRRVLLTESFKAYLVQKKFPTISSQFEIASKLKQFDKKYNIIHSNSLFGFPYLFEGGKPFIAHIRASQLRLAKVSMNEMIYFGIFKSLKESSKFLLTSVIEKYVVEKCDMIFANSKETAAALVQDYKIQLGKIKIVPNGVEVPSIANGDRIRKMYNLENKKILLFVGHLDFSKGIYRLIKIMEKIAMKRSDVVLLLVGGGKFENVVRKYASRMKNIIPVGHILGDELWDFYAAADLFVYPSAPGTTLLEAMASAKPFIVYYTSKDNTPGVPMDIIKRERIGEILFDTDLSELLEVICARIDDYYWLQEQGQRAADLVKKYFSWDIIARRVVQYYKELLDKY
jgi:glycosyltransferase involved in cell wall biosynthesis